MLNASFTPIKEAAKIKKSSNCNNQKIISLYPLQTAPI